MSQTNSISIFKDFIVEELPNYALVSDDQLLEDCKWFLGIEISKNQVSSQIIDYVDSLGNEKDEVSEYLLCEIAQLYLETNNQDELINLLLNAEHSRFKKIINEVKQISGGIHYVENAAKKSILQELETKLEAEDFEIVLQRIERKDQKERLKELEEQFEQENVHASFDFNLTGTDDRNLNYVLDPEIKQSIERKLQIRSFIRIAAIFILFAIPSSIMLFMVSNGGTPRNIRTAKQNKNDKSANGQEYYASAMTEIDIPNVNEKTSNVEVDNYFNTQGFGASTEIVQIKINNIGGQIKYLKAKKESITKYQKQIENKKFKNKKSTLDSLSSAVKTLDKLQARILLKEMTYEFDGSEVKLFTIKAKDLQKMKVFNYNERERDTYYLYLDNAFYELKTGKGKLQILTDTDRIEQLERLRIIDLN
jgi:hypothetical protein